MFPSAFRFLRTLISRAVSFGCKPIEGSYVDVNGDGAITSEDRVASDNFAEPQYLFAFFSTVRYKKWNGGFRLRGE